MLVVAVHVDHRSSPRCVHSKFVQFIRTIRWWPDRWVPWTIYLLITVLVPALRSGEASREKLSCSWPLYPFSLFSAVDHRYYVLFLLIANYDMMCSIPRNPFVIINQPAQPISSVGHWIAGDRVQPPYEFPKRVYNHCFTAHPEPISVRY